MEKAGEHLKTVPSEATDKSSWGEKSRGLGWLGRAVPGPGGRAGGAGGQAREPGV